MAVDTHAPLLLDKIEWHRTGSTENGFALHEVVTTPSGSIATEVIELSEAPLDPKLFQPPDGFQRVLQLPGEYPLSFQMRVKLVWEWLEDALHSF